MSEANSLLDSKKKNRNPPQKTLTEYFALFQV